MEQVKSQASRGKAGTRELDAKTEVGGNAASPAWAQDPEGREAAAAVIMAGEPLPVSGAAPVEAQSREVARGEQAEVAPRPESTAPQPRYGRRVLTAKSSRCLGVQMS